MKKKSTLFLTAFAQVLFVAANTYFIANTMMYAVAACGFLISFIWSFNIKRVAFGTMSDRIVYSIGASAGGLTGLYIATHI